MDYMFFLELALILFATKVFGLVMRKIGLPQVVGALLAGILLGPSLLGWVKPSETLTIMAEIGVIMIMFTAGVQTNIKDIKKTGLAALLVAAAGVLLPLLLGFLVAALFTGGFQNMDTKRILQCVFMGVVITATSVSITVETLKELGKLKSDVGTIILSAAIIDDVIGIALLSVVSSFTDLTVNPWLAIGKMVAFFVVAGVAGIFIHKLFRFLSNRYPQKRRLPIFAFVLCLLYAFCAEHFFGVADITGAYVAGLTISGMKDSDYIEKRIDINAYLIFAPIFFAGIGIKTDFHNFDPTLLLFALVFVLAAILAKAMGCFAAAKVLKMSTRDSMAVGIGMVARGEVALIILQKGINAGVIPQQYISIGIVLVLVSSLIAPVLLRLMFRHQPKIPQAVAMDIIPTLASDPVPVEKPLELTFELDEPQDVPQASILDVLIDAPEVSTTNADSSNSATDGAGSAVESGANGAGSAVDSGANGADSAVDSGANGTGSAVDSGANGAEGGATNSVGGGEESAGGKDVESSANAEGLNPKP